MINIILKNKKLIMLYKYSIKIFKFLNKHLYILSILSFLRKSRNSIYYKFISWTIKIVILLNLIISSGLFFSTVDLVTPLNIIYNFYNDLLGPYIEMMRIKYNELNNITTNTETKYVNSNIKNINTSSPTIIDLDPVSNIDNDEHLELKFNYKSYLFYAGLGLIIYFIYFIPGGSTPPAEIVTYNWFNQALINVKVAAKDYWEIVKYIFDEPKLPRGPNTPDYMKSPNMTEMKEISPDIWVKNLPGDKTPIASTSKLPPLNLNYPDDGIPSSLFNPNKISKGVQTNINYSDMKIMNLALKYDIRTNMKYFRGLVLEEFFTNELFNTSLNDPVSIDEKIKQKSILLKSTQLLDTKNNNDI